MRGEFLTYACQEKNEIRHSPTHQKRDTKRKTLRIPIFIKFSNTKGIYIMKKNVILGLAILIVILTAVIVLCAFTSPEEEGVLVVVSEYYADEAQQDVPEAETKESNVKVHLDGSQKPPFSE